MKRFSEYYPTLDQEQAVNWIKKKVSLPSKEVNKAEELEVFKEEARPLIVYLGQLEGKNCKRLSNTYRYHLSRNCKNSSK